MICNETVTEDPETGVRKRRVVTERVVTTKAFQIIPISDGLNHSVSTTNETTTPHGDISKMFSNGKLICKNGETSSNLSTEMSPTRITRIIQFSINPFREIDYDRIADMIIVTRVKPNSSVKVSFSSYQFELFAARLS